MSLSPSLYTDFSALTKLKVETRAASPESLQQAAKQFEGILLGMMLKNARDASMHEALTESEDTRFYQDMFDQQIALSLTQSKNGIGLADMIVRQLSAQKGEPGIPDMPAKNVRADPTGGLMATDAQPSSGDNLLDSRSPHAFVKSIWPAAEKAAQALGVSPEMLVAQAALETGWGKNIIRREDGQSSFNLFNIKAGRTWEGASAKKITLEYERGVATPQSANFRSYPHVSAAFEDYVRLIREQPRYANVLAQKADPQAYFSSLQASGYATDPRYAGKIMRLLNSDVFLHAAQLARNMT